ncbi:MAG: O-antigen ligase family protein [Clostridiales bacterium]|nr:O-antigen ligase family protein [Clostridiales bacterium]
MTELVKKTVSCLTGERFMMGYVLSCMILVPLTELIFQLMGFMFFGSAYVITIYGVIGVFIGFINLYYSKERHWSDFFFITLNIFLVFSLIFSCDLTIFIEGTPDFIERPEYIIAYYCLMLVSFRISSVRNRKILLGCIVGISLFQACVAVPQTFGYKILEAPYGATSYEVYGLTQNDCFYGGLSTLFVGCCSGIFILCEKKLYRLIAVVSLLIAVYCSVNTMARLAWVGDISILLFFVISILIMRKRNPLDSKYNSYLNRYILTIITCLAGVLLAILNPNERPLLYDRFFRTSRELSEGDFGNGRGNIWYYCLSSVPDHWLTGIGLSNIPQCFTENPNWHEGDYITNFAHNIYIHILATQGVFAFINYMVFLVISTVKAVRKILFTDDKTEQILTWIFLAMFTGYAVSAFFNCRICYVEMYFYIIIGLMDPIIAPGSKTADIRKAEVK